MRQGGFTLIELLLVVAIMGIIASVTLLRADLLRADAEIKAAAQQIINTSKIARQNSVSVAEHHGIFPSYGIYFDLSDPRRLIVYANCEVDDDGDGKVTGSDNFAYNDTAHQACADVTGLSFSSNPAFVEEVILEGSVVISSIEVVERNGAPYNSNEVSINYLRPDPTVWIIDGGGDLLSAGYVKITIKDRSNNYEKDIIFYTSALVETTSRRVSEI